MNSTYQNDETFKVEIEKSERGTIVRVVGLSVSTNKTQFDNAYRLVSELHRRTLKLDEVLKREHEILHANKQVENLWVQDGVDYMLSSSVSEASYRIALSLLKTYPACKSQAIVVKETGIAQKTVSNHLGGRKKTVQSYFKKCETGHQLSEDGLDWVLSTIVPAVLSN